MSALNEDTLWDGNVDCFLDQQDNVHDIWGQERL